MACARVATGWLNRADGWLNRADTPYFTVTDCSVARTSATLVAAAPRRFASRSAIATIVRVGFTSA